MEFGFASGSALISMARLMENMAIKSPLMALLVLLAGGAIFGQNCDGFTTLYPGQNISSNDYTFQFVDIIMGVTGNFDNSPAVFYVYRDGTNVENITLYAGESKIYQDSGGEVKLSVCNVHWFFTFSGYSAAAKVETSGGLPAGGNSSSLPGAGIPSCSTLPTLELSTSAIQLQSGKVAQVNATITATHGASCGTQIYGVDFTNGFDGNRFYLWLDGENERNLFTLQGGESRTFAAKIGIPPGVPEGNYTVQLTAYSEADHWKQESKKVSVEAWRAAASDAFIATNLEVGWNALPYANGIPIFGCENITYAYRYSPSLGEYVRMERFAAEFSADESLEDEGALSALFVFSKQKCTMRSYVSPQMLDSLPISIGKGALVSVLPKWDGKAVEEVAMQICPNGASISKWDATLQKWVNPQQVRFGEAIRITARQGTVCPGSGVQ